MDRNIPVTDEMIQTKARDLCNIDPNFKYSSGWVQKFKKRYHLSLRTICGESGSVNKETLARDRELVRRVTCKYNLCDTFNLDETALFYKLPPNKTLASKLSKLEGIKQSKERLSIAFIVNALGTEFIKPIIIGHHRKPRCFKNVWWHRAYCSYFYNKTAWMTMNIFESWLLEFNEKMKKENRHVLLLIDNAGGHNKSLELKNKLTNVEVSYLPANTTSVLQPLDQGIIRTFKVYYRKLLVEYLLDLSDNEKEYTPITTTQTIINIYKAWRKVNESTIVNCWRKAGILINNTNNDYIDELDIEHKEEVQCIKTDYAKMLERFRVDYIEQNFEHLDLDFEQYLDCDSNAQTNDEMSDEAIADFCLKKMTVEVEEEMDNLIIVNEEEKIPTLAEAKLAFKIVFDRLSQSKDFSVHRLSDLSQ